MKFLRKLWSARDEEQFQRKVVEMATDFCLEASVLVGVLGILESAISAHGVPSAKVFGLSIGFCAVFFTVGCIIQADRAVVRDAEPEQSEEERP